MAWYFAGVRLFVQDRGLEWDSIVARLNPIGGGTEKQFFGYDERIEKIKALVVGTTDLQDLFDLTTSGEAYFLFDTPVGDGNFALKHMSARQMKTVCQTIRPDLPTTTPVFEVDLELYIE